MQKKIKITLKKLLEWILINIPIAFFINEILKDKKKVIVFSNWIILFLLILPFTIIILKKKFKTEKYLYNYLMYSFSIIFFQIFIYKFKIFDKIKNLAYLVYKTIYHNELKGVVPPPIVIYLILFITLFCGFIVNYIKKYKKIDIDNQDKSGLIDSRKQDLEKLKNILDNTLDSIIIDDEWGNGKTFFIKEFMKVYEKNYEFIYIKAPYFQTREEFRKVFLTELNKAFIKSGIFNTSISNLTKYFGIEIQGITLNQIEKNYNETIEEIIKKMCKLDKRTVIVLDDLDRIEKGEDIQEIFNFIGEINIELREKIGLITLSSYNKLNEKVQNHTEEKEGEDYLEKYFDKKFYLQKVNGEELIEYFCKDKNLQKLIKQCKQAIEKYYDLEVEKQNITYLSKQTFRNIERLVKNISNINIDKIIENKEIYKKIFVLFEIFELLLPESWENLEIDPKIKSLLNNIFIYKDNPEINFERYYQFIDSCANEVLNYKKSKTQNYFSKYQNIKNFITKKSINNSKNILIEEYLETAKIFKFSEDEKKQILDFFIRDNRISKYDFIQLYIQFELNYKLYPDDITTFIEKINNKSNNCDNSSIDKYSLITLICKFLLRLNLISLKELGEIAKLNEDNNLSEEKIFEKFNQHKNKQEIYKILEFILEIYNETSSISKYNILMYNIKLGIINFKFKNDLESLLNALKEAKKEFKDDTWYTIEKYDFIVDVEEIFNQRNPNLDSSLKKYLFQFHKNEDENTKLIEYIKTLRENNIIKANIQYIVNLNILELDWKEINPTIKEITDRLKNNNIDIEKFKKKLKEENKDKYKEWKDILNELQIK